MENALDYEAIGKRVREERTRQGISIEALAMRAGISYVHMSHLETNSTKVSLPALVAVVNALNITADMVLCDNLKNRQSAHLAILDELLRTAAPEQTELIIELAKTVLRKGPQNTG